jgi:hypothetical protein
MRNVIPKTINIKKYLSTDNFSVNNRHVVIKSSQTPTLYYKSILLAFQLSSSHKIRDGNEYPVNRVLARTFDYRIPKSVFGYSENFFFMKIMIKCSGQ